VALELGMSRGRPLRLRAPVMIAAGCAGDATRLAGASWLADVGAVVTHSLTSRPDRSSTVARVHEAACGVLYDPAPSGPGLEATLDRAWRVWQTLPAPIIVSLAPESASELAAMLETCSSTPAVAAVEVNLDLLTEVADSRPASEAVRRLLEGLLILSTVPVFVKLAPGYGEVELAAIAAGAGADALVLGHGWPAARAQPRGGRLRDYRLGGPAIQPLTLAAVERLASICDLPLIACGGVCSGAAAGELLRSGARAVQVGSAQLRDPETAARVARELAAGAPLSD